MKIIIDGEHQTGLYLYDSIDCVNVENVTEIGDHFITCADQLKSIDLTALKNVTKIGRNFLASCHALKSLDLSPFSNVTEIGEGFLYDCASLEYIDLTPLAKATKIRMYRFLWECPLLKEIKCPDTPFWDAFKRRYEHSAPIWG